MQCPSLGTWTLWYVEWYQNNTCFIWASGPWWYKWSPAACLLAVLCTLIGQSIFPYWLLSGVLWAIGRFLIFVLNPVSWKSLISFLMIYSAETCSVLSWVRRCVTLLLVVWDQETEVPCVSLHKMLQKQTASLQSWHVGAKAGGPQVASHLALTRGAWYLSQTKQTVEENNTQESLIPSLVPKEIVEMSDLSKAMYPWANFYHILIHVYILLQSVISV